MSQTLEFGDGVAVHHIECLIDPVGFGRFEDDFRPFIERSDLVFKAIPGGETWVAPIPTREKLLEYYLTLQAIPLDRNRVYLDGASCLSLFPQYLAERFGAPVFRQDLFYAPGLRTVRFPEVGYRGDRPARRRKRGVAVRCIGGPGEDLPLSSNSVDAITLHCSLEHFEGDSDWQFVREAMRVLRPGGRLFVIPFYCGDAYQEITHPDFAPGCRFQRYYDPPTFRSRVLSRQDAVDCLEVRYYRNVTSLGPEFYCHYSLALVKRSQTQYGIITHGGGDAETDESVPESERDS